MGVTNMKGADFAVVKAWIGSFEVHSTEDHTLGLEVVRDSKGVVLSAVLNLYDDTALYIESLIYGGARKVRFQYGWDGKLGPTYQGDIIKHKVTFRGNSGATVRIEISSSVIVEDTNPRLSANYHDMKIHEIAADVAQKEGWEVVYITECDHVPDPDKQESCMPFWRENETGKQFIKKLLLHAVKSGHKTVVARWGWNPQSNKIKFLMKALDEKISILDTYTVGGDDERIIAWEPSINEAVISLMGSSDIKTEAIDHVTNEYFKNEVKGDKPLAFQVTRVLPSSSSNAGEVKKFLEYIWKRAQELYCTANLVITGTPRWEPTDHIEVIAYTKQGVVHHSSGVYTIDKGRDVIDATGFKTYLELTRIHSKDEMDKIQNPFTEQKGRTDSGTEKIVDHDTVPKDSAVSPGSGGGGSSGSSRAANGRPVTVKDVTFPVQTPVRGDLVRVTRSVGGVDVVSDGVFIDSNYVRVNDEEGSRVVRMEDFVQDCPVQYRRSV